MNRLAKLLASRLEIWERFWPPVRRQEERILLPLLRKVSGYQGTGVVVERVEVKRPFCFVRLIPELLLPEAPASVVQALFVFELLFRLVVQMGESVRLREDLRSLVELTPYFRGPFPPRFSLFKDFFFDRTAPARGRPPVEADGDD